MNCILYHTGTNQTLPPFGLSLSKARSPFMFRLAQHERTPGLSVPKPRPTLLMNPIQGKTACFHKEVNNVPQSA
jgi:hypothetical protein